MRNSKAAEKEQIVIGAIKAGGCTVLKAPSSAIHHMPLRRSITVQMGRSNNRNNTQKNKCNATKLP